MAKNVRGLLLRSVSPKALRGTLAIPAQHAGLFCDGYDACVVFEVGRDKMRVNLAISSGGELVLPQWLREKAADLAVTKGVDQVNVYLSTRPIWLAEGEQDDALKDIWARQNGLEAWDRLSTDERKHVALRWLAEELAAQ